VLSHSVSPHTRTGIDTSLSLSERMIGELSIINLNVFLDLVGEKAGRNGGKLG